jgi:hypothetical protein
VIRLRPLAGCLLAVFLLSGCAAYTAVEPAKHREIGGVFRVEPSTLWSASKEGNREVWTINGFGLDAISFVTNVADGEAVSPKIQDKDAPTFRAGMSATDVVDLYESVLAYRGFSQVEAQNLRPHAISGQNGFRFDYTAFDDKGLGKRGTVIGLIDPEKGLNLVIFEAAAEHYYDASLAAAEKVLGSLERI